MQLSQQKDLVGVEEETKKDQSMPQSKAQSVNGQSFGQEVQDEVIHSYNASNRQKLSKELNHHKHEYLEKFLSQNVKILSCKPTQTPIQLVSDALAYKVDQTSFQPIKIAKNNIQSDLDKPEFDHKNIEINQEEGFYDENGRYLKAGLVTKGQPLQNFDRSNEWNLFPPSPS